MTTGSQWYDVEEERWPDLRQDVIVLKPPRVGVDRTTGRMLTGWNHVEQSMHVIFITRFHSRVLRRWVGSFVPHLLGDNLTVRAVSRFYWAVATSLDLNEPNYRIQQVKVATRSDGTPLNSPEEIRLGHFTVQHIGVYRPRAHLGDETPEVYRNFALTGRGYGAWDRVTPPA